MIKAPSQIMRLQREIGEIISQTEAGGRLPSEPALAKKLGVSRATLREAMRTFEIQGLIRRRQGSGTYVTHLSYNLESGLEVLESIEAMAERISLDVQMIENKIVERPATQDEAELFNIDSGSDVIHLSRVMQAEDRPVAYLYDIIPSRILEKNELEMNFTGSVLDYFNTRGDQNITSSRCEITAEPASPDVARLMEIQRGDVLLKFVSFLYTEHGDIVIHSFSYFLPGYFRFHVVRKVN